MKATDPMLAAEAIEAIATRLQRRAEVAYGTAAASLDLDAAAALRALLAEVDAIRVQCLKLGVSREAWREMALAFHSAWTADRGYGDRVAKARAVLAEIGEDETLEIELAANRRRR